MERERSRLVPRFRLCSPAVRSRQTIGAAAFAALALALAAVQPISNPDTFGHLAQGRAIVENGGPPRLDPFSFWRAQPQPWVNYEWLSDAVSWLVHRALGWNGLLALALLMVAGAGAALVLLAARRSGPRAAWLASLLLVAAVPAVRLRLSARPHLIALPFAVLYLAVLTSEEAFADRRRGTRAMIFLALAQVLWANLHGSQLLGLAIAGASAIAALPDRERARQLGLTTLLCAIASGISPWGPEMALDAVKHVFDPAYREVVAEWQPLTELGWTWTTGYALLTGAGIALVAPTAFRAGLAARTWLGVSVLLSIAAFRSQRFVEEMLLLSAPLVAVAIAERLKTPLERAGPAVIGASMLAAAGVAVLGYAQVDSEIPFGTGADLRFVPGEAGEHVARELGEVRTFGSMPTEWYLMFAAPDARVLVDGRVPFYGPEHVRAMTRALGVPGALEPVLQRYPIEALIVQHSATDEAASAEALAADPRFVRSWIDGDYAVYVTPALARRQRLDPARFDALPGGYVPAAILAAPDARVPAIREDLGHLGDGPQARAFAAFVRAMLRLRPLAREGGWAGYRPPSDEAERAAVALAHRELRHVQRRLPRVPVLAAQAALVAALDCDLAEARARLDDARSGRESRETIFGAAEIHLRAGHRAAAERFLENARRMPGGATDAWVAALAEELAAGVRCGGGGR